MNRFVFALWSLLGVIPLVAPPQYTDYSVTKIFRGTHAAPVLSSRNARMFRTQLRNAVKYGPNFAGHYTLARWGCGAGCVTVAVMDPISGQVWFAPFEIEDARTENGNSCYGSEFEIDSELFLAAGRVNGRVGIHYFRCLGRDHNPGTQTVLMASAGIKGGQVIGASDEFGFKAMEQSISYHDLHATMLPLLGLDHTKLTYRFNGRDMRLTDVYGTLIPQIVNT